MSQAPVVALAGPTGHLGRDFAAAFSKATTDGLFRELRLLTTNASNEHLQSYAKDTSGKLKVIQVDYKEKSSLEQALDGVDVVVSTISGIGHTASGAAIARAAVAKGVKAYLPSEWGSDYDTFPHPVALWEDKKRHLEEVKGLGLKVFAVSAPLFTDMTFCSIFGVNSAEKTWAIPGDGTKRASFVSKADTAQYAIRIVLLAYSDPSSLPPRIRIYSDTISWNECADLMDAASGEPVKRTYVPREQFLTGYNAAHTEGNVLGELLTALNLMYIDGLHEFSDSDNKLLNPGHRYFKPQTIADYAKEVGGKPWLTGNPFQ